VSGGHRELAAAADGSADGVAWFGNEGELRAAVEAWRPGATLHAAHATGDWEALLAEADTSADVLVWRGIQDKGRDLRARLATAEVGYPGLVVFMRPLLLPAGFWAIDPHADEQPNDPNDPAPTPEDLAVGRAPASLLAAHDRDDDVVARRADIVAQISAGLVHPEKRRRVIVGPEPRRLTEYDAALWSHAPSLRASDLPHLHWPVVLRHPHLLLGIVRAARGDASGDLWRALAHRVAEFSFRAPALDWARRAYLHHHTPEMETLLGQRYQEALRLHLERMDVRAVATLLDRWARDQPDGFAPLKRALVADAWNDDEAVLGTDPAIVSGGRPASRAEALRLHARAHLRRGDEAAAEASLIDALAIERAAGEARDLGAWASLVHRHGAPTPAPDGGVVTRAALADVMRRRGRLDEAASVLAGLVPVERPEVWLVRGRLAEAQGQVAAAAEDYAHAIAASQTALDEANARLAQAGFHARHGDLDAARFEAIHAWSVAMSGVPAVRRLAVGLAAWDLVGPTARDAIEAEVALAIDDAPATLRAAKSWRTRL
jgi:tetratricopeptide (TPR) repeat protein